MGRYTINNRVKIYFDVAGKKSPALVLLSGFGGDRLLWKYNVKELSKHFTVITIDNRGAGKSDHADEYTMEKFAADVKCVLHELDISSVHIAGTSMGGLIALQFYRDYPEMVKSISLISSIAGIPKRFQKLVEKLIKNSVYNIAGGYFIPKMIDAYNSVIMKRKEGGGAIFENFALPEFDMDVVNFLVGNVRKTLTKETYFEMIEKYVVYKINDKIIDFFESALKQKDNPCDKKGQLEAVLKCTHHHALKSIEVPVLILHGKNDKILNLNEAVYLNKNIKNSDLIVYGNCGHLLFMENVERFNQDLIRFIKSIDENGEKIAV